MWQAARADKWRYGRRRRTFHGIGRGTCSGRRRSAVGGRRRNKVICRGFCQIVPTYLGTNIHFQKHRCSIRIFRAFYRSSNGFILHSAPLPNSLSASSLDRLAPLPSMSADTYVASVTSFAVSSTAGTDGPARTAGTGGTSDTGGTSRAAKTGCSVAVAVTFGTVLQRAYRAHHPLRGSQCSPCSPCSAHSRHGRGYIMYIL